MIKICLSILSHYSFLHKHLTHNSNETIDFPSVCCEFPSLGSYCYLPGITFCYFKSCLSNKTKTKHSFLIKLALKYPPPTLPSGEMKLFLLWSPRALHIYFLLHSHFLSRINVICVCVLSSLSDLNFPEGENHTDILLKPNIETNI